MSLLKIAHQAIQDVLTIGDQAIDATLGNGHDTLFLAQQVGLTGKVYGFDIQQVAIDTSMQKLAQHQLLSNVILIKDNHANMLAHIPNPVYGRIKACMFNLGYLPKADKQITTQIDSTLAALNSVCQLLAPQGIITIIAYTGHAGGIEETNSVQAWCEQLNPAQFTQRQLLSEIDKPDAPKLFVVQKLS